MSVIFCQNRAVGAYLVFAIFGIVFHFNGVYVLNAKFIGYYQYFEMKGRPIMYVVQSTLGFMNAVQDFLWISSGL